MVFLPSLLLLFLVSRKTNFSVIIKYMHRDNDIELVLIIRCRRS